MKHISLLIFTLLASLSVFAQDALPGQNIFDAIEKFLASAGGQATVIAIVLEFVLRLSKSQKPLSIAYVISDVLKKSGEMLMSIGKLLDKVLPQRLK